MKRSRIAPVALALALGALIVGPARGQLDPVKALAGRWEGAIDTRQLPSAANRDPNRTLVVTSVSQKDGRWVAQGRFGITGQRLEPVQMDMDTSGRNPTLRFARGPLTWQLELIDDRHLAGTVTTPAMGRRGSEPLPVRLEKVD